MVAWVFVLPTLAETRGQSNDWHSLAVPGCVWVRAEGEGIGTGWIVDVGRGWILTCHHVVGDAAKVTVSFAQESRGTRWSERETIDDMGRSVRITGRIRRRDVRRDLALIEVANLPPSAKALPLAEASAVPGQAVRMVGHRGDLSELWSVATGTVRQRYVTGRGYPWRGQRLAENTELLLMDLPISTGDSGGPVLNERGEVVGMAAAVLFPVQRSTAAIDLLEIRHFLGQPSRSKEQRTDSAIRVYETMLCLTAAVESLQSTSRGLATLVDREHRLWVTTVDAVGDAERVMLLHPAIVQGKVLAENAAYFWANRVPAYVVARDPRRGLALLEAERLPTNAIEPTWPEGHSRPGERLHTIANPINVEARWLYTPLVIRQAGHFVVTRDPKGERLRGWILQGQGGGEGGAPILDDQGHIRGLMSSRHGPDPLVAYGIDQSEIRRFHEACRSWWQPKSADEWRQRGRRRSRWRQFELARADLQQASRLAARDARVFLALACLELDAGRLAEARAAVEQALIVGDGASRAETRAWYAEILSRLGDIPSAERECEAALAEDNRCAAAYATRAAIRMKRGEMEAAHRDAEEASWIEPNEPRWQHRLGQIHAAGQKWDQAVIAYSRAIALNPNDPSLYEDRATAYEQRTPPDPEKARRDRQTASRLR
jgi:tetratricopeptide (TPR) repeat protein